MDGQVFLVFGTASVLLISSVVSRAEARTGDPWPAEGPGIGTGGKNVLIVVADDLGVDRVAAYGEHPTPPKTPNVDALAADGMLFRNAWASPSCAPSRALMLTGRYGFRTGIGRNEPMGSAPAHPWDPPPPPGFSLPLVEWTIPEVLQATPAAHYSTAALGKWHLAVPPGDAVHPLESGFEHFSGSLRNFVGLENYFHWTKCTDGEFSDSLTYATTDTADDAAVAVTVLPEPWFLWVSFNAPHSPFHKPPGHLHSEDLSGSGGADKVTLMKAMTEALDAEVGRVLAALTPEVRGRTTIVFVGDNGTAKQATEPPFDPKHAKQTLYEGGLNVPLIIAGPPVTQQGSECAALVQVTDLFATTLELCNSPIPLALSTGSLDSVSLVPYLEDPDTPSIRETVYAERFSPNGFGPYDFHDRAVREARFKLIRRWPEDVDELYDLQADPFEQTDLMSEPLGAAAELAYRVLDRALLDLEESGHPPTEDV